MKCVVCGAKVGKNDTFCTQCGNEIRQYCTGCGAQVPVDAVFCESCGSKLGDKKANGKKNGIVLIGILVLGIFAAVIILMLQNVTKKHEYTVYIKEGIIQSADVSQKKQKRKAIETDVKQNVAENVADIVQYSPDKKYIFYPSNMEDLLDSYHLWAAKVGKEEEAVLIDSDVRKFLVVDDVIYFQSSNDVLYKSTYKGEKTKIASKVVWFNVYEEEKILLWSEYNRYSGCDWYWMNLDKDNSIMFASGLESYELWSIEGIKDKNSFYLCNTSDENTNDLVWCKDMKEIVTIDSDVLYYRQGNGNDVYYTKYGTVELLDEILSDYGESDTGYDIDTYELYKFDGKEKILIDNKLIDAYDFIFDDSVLKYAHYNFSAEKISEVLEYAEEKNEEITNTWNQKMEEYSYEDFDEYFWDYGMDDFVDLFKEICILTEKNEHIILDRYMSDIYLDDSNPAIACGYVYDLAKNSYDLYSFDIRKGWKDSKRCIEENIEYRSDIIVNGEDIYYVMMTDPVYGSFDGEAYEGDLYCNGQLIDNHVYLNGLEIVEGTLYYKTDVELSYYYGQDGYDEWKGLIYTLKSFDGRQSKTIAEDVIFQHIVDDKNITLVTDFNVEMLNGNLVHYDGKHLRTIDEDVLAFQGMERENVY